MPSRTLLTVVAVALLLVTSVPCRADSVSANGAKVGRSTLNCENMQRALRTGNPDEETYIIYVCALMDQGVLPRRLVESAFQWARTKPFPKKVQYFKFALVKQGARLGLRLPRGTPTLRPNIEGRVVQKILGVALPVPAATVSIKGTDRTTTTDNKGTFTFRNVPYGGYTIEATRQILVVTWTGSTRVALPNVTSPTQSATVEIELKLIP